MFWDLLGGIFEFLFGLLFPSSDSGDEPDSEEVETT
ncbi:hypothetical protein KR038_012178 [Drosophila bunnanda]|nr:hypothetical protein KR038_012178 [Drosophila bunnanda]